MTNKPSLFRPTMPNLDLKLKALNNELVEVMTTRLKNLNL